ncbi:MAG: N-6 DNA methylase [Planctomycetota bacterium]|jgi:hypothetical protein
MRSVIRRPGQVYTPAPLARRVVRRVLEPLVRGKSRAEISALRICDPACGEGIFLLEASRYLGGAQECLVGADVDAAAVARARRALPGADLRVADALRCDWPGRFDAVLGNPPWISYSGRHAQPLPEEDRRFYAAHFETFAGWPSLHGLFLELAVRLSRGRIGLLLPAQVCDLDGYGPVRAHVRRHCRIEAVLDCGEEGFAHVVQPCCALFLAAGGAAGGAAPFALRPEADGGLLAHLDRFARPPPDAFADIGVHTGNCARKLLRPGGAPVREGKDIAAYRLGPPRKRLILDPPREPGDYFRVRPYERYRAVPVVLRQTALRPIAALHEPPAYFRNSVLACRGIADVPAELVVAWLNSTVVGWYHRARVREASQRAFPQLKLKHLRDLPMPPWDEAPGALRGLARAVAREGRLDLAPRLEARVSLWFGLDEATHARLEAE